MIDEPQRTGAANRDSGTDTAKAVGSGVLLGHHLLLWFRCIFQISQILQNFFVKIGGKNSPELLADNLKLQNP